MKASFVKFNSPMGICFNTNDRCMYVCDTNNHTVRKVTLQGRVSSFAKNLFYASYIVSYHKENSIFVLHLYKNIVTKISSTGEVSEFAKLGPVGPSAMFCYPSGLAIDQLTGNLFFSEFWSHTIHMVTPQGEVSQLAGTHGVSGCEDGTREEAKFNWPGALWFDDVTNSLLVCDCRNDRIRRVSLNGEVSTVCRVKDPSCITGSANGTTLVGTPTNVYQVAKQLSGTYEATLLAGQTRGKKKNGRGDSWGNLRMPLGIAVHEPSQTCFVADGESKNIKRLEFVNE